MNKQEHFIYDAIYKESLRQGASERKAKDHAVQGLSDYRKCRYNPRGLKVKPSPGGMVEQRIFMAVKESKNG